MNKFAIGCGGLLVIVLFIVFVIGLFFWGTYNRLVGLQQGVDTQWAQVQTVYQRRADLIPNLVNTVAGAANFEKSTLTEVTNARASADRCQATPGIPGRAGTIEQRALAFAGGGRKLSATHCDRKFPRLASAA